MRLEEEEEREGGREKDTDRQTDRYQFLLLYDHFGSHMFIPNLGHGHGSVTF